MFLLEKKIAVTVGILLSCCLFFTAGCSGVFKVALGQNFAIVDAKPGDTLSSISKTYLGDSKEAWRIADFNGIKEITPGERVIVPLEYYRIGGLTVEGYQTVPVLTYHGFSEKTVKGKFVSRKSFELQMKYLKENGYTVITIEQFMDFLHLGIQLPRKSVVITIDDGWRSTFDIAFPILKKYEFPAVLFIYTDFIGTKNALTWDQVFEMNENNIAVHCKTKTNRNLTKLEKGESIAEYRESLEKELLNSKKLIENKLLRECNYLAYPYGMTNGLIISLAKKYGYSAGFTTSRKSNPFFVNDFLINRSVIYGEFDLDRFRNNLSTFRKKALK